MSYCRFSSDDYQSDVYVYESAHLDEPVWVVHVAQRRWVFHEPLPPEVDMTQDIDAWLRRRQEVSAQIDDTSRGHWIELPEPVEGSAHELDSPGECADLLESLAGQGFHVPEGVIDELRTEQASLAG